MEISKEQEIFEMPMAGAWRSPHRNTKGIWNLGVSLVGILIKGELFNCQRSCCGEIVSNNITIIGDDVFGDVFGQPT
jgi:hypothetical protein